jgi:16S rRNA C967 or C1407 C5-methylase (RsmB/RsmF family)
LQTNPGDKRFKKVKFVLLDPSCSGSGMLSNYMRDLT